MECSGRLLIRKVMKIVLFLSRSHFHTLQVKVKHELSATRVET